MPQLLTSPAQSGQRLDAVLAEAFADYSRVALKRAIDAGQVLVNRKPCKPSYRLKGGETIDIELPDLPRDAPEPEAIPLDVLYEDELLIVLNKPPGMVVHPAKGNWGGTLTNALAYRFAQLSDLGGESRPGIVHRLDRDTSGVMVVAKTNQAHAMLARQFQDRTTQKEYLAIVVGVPDRDRDRITQPIGAHPHQREKMAIRADHPTSRFAETYYEVQERFTRHAVVRAFPKTGRTHQIRVHLVHAGYPILCDRLYGGHAEFFASELLGSGRSGPILLNRQALHAARLSFEHPADGQLRTFEAEIPADMKRVLESLRQS